MSQSGNPSIEVVIFWGDVVLRREELAPPRPWFVGDGTLSGGSVDFTLPEGASSSVRTALVDVSGDEVLVRVPPGARAERRGVGSFGAPPCTGGEVALGDGTVDVHAGPLVFSVRRSSEESRCPRAPLVPDGRGTAAFAAAFLACASLVSAMAFFTPPLGLTADEDAERDRIYLMSTYLDAAAERETKREVAQGEDSGGAAADAPREPARGEPGKMGPLHAREQGGRASGATGEKDPRPATTRAEELRATQTFGIIGLLASGTAASTLAPWDDPGAGPVLAAGGFFGDHIGESPGMNGLTLLGFGDGGFGHSDQIGLGSIGTCTGTVCGQGIGDFGIGKGRGGPGHLARAPHMTAAPPVTSGSLPPDVIQRVVRQSFGRFRGCYEDGLRGNPTLEGRVTARFVIARDGSVATVQSGATDLPDARVVACVMRTYSGLSFPPPKDGVVTVSYPLVFSPAT